MGLPSFVALTVLTTLALLVRFGVGTSSTVAATMAERAALEWVGSGRVTHHSRAHRDGRAVFRVLVRDAVGSIHALDVCRREGRVIAERLA
jgi:hypothetical protein